MEMFNQQEKLLLLEGALTSACLAEGLECLKHANIYNKGMYYQAFMALATGVERLLKLLIIYEYKISNNDNLPDNKFLKQKGHNLYDMFKSVAPHILEDELNNKIIKFLSNFAMTTRYYNLDVLTGKDIKLLNPLQEWNSIETKILEVYAVKNKKLNNADVITDCETREERQEYGVVVFYKIIKSLVYKLTRLEMDNNLFPCLREFFINFRGNFTDSEIRKKKSWIINRRLKGSANKGYNNKLI